MTDIRTRTAQLLDQLRPLSDAKPLDEKREYRLPAVREASSSELLSTNYLNENHAGKCTTNRLRYRRCDLGR